MQVVGSAAPGPGGRVAYLVWDEAGGEALLVDWDGALPELLDEVVDVLELAVDRGKADVRHLVELPQLVHHEPADFRGRDLALGPVLQRRLDAVSHRLDRGEAHRTLLAGLEQPRHQLLPLEALAAAVLLHHHVRDLIDPLVAGEPPAAVEALAAAADDLALLALARVDDLIAEMSAERALHRGASPSLGPHPPAPGADRR